MDSPSFTSAALQLVSNAQPTRVQVMPSQHGQAAVFVTIPCQITTIEFSPLLEIASVVLNSSSKQVLVHLAGAGPSAANGTQVFEIADLQLSEGGDAGMIQLNRPEPDRDVTRLGVPDSQREILAGLSSARHQHPFSRPGQVGSKRPPVKV